MTRNDTLDTSSQPLINGDHAITTHDDDKFGYSPFAQVLADAICNTPSPAGVVMALNGPWGSGKSSLLNLVKCSLNEQKTDKPIVIEFNPWWFQGSDQLTGQLLNHFHNALVGESGALRDAGDMLAKYAGTISKAVTYTTNVPWLDKVLTPLLRLLARKPIDVPHMKAKIGQTLSKAERRVLILIDDLDRLTPSEVMEVFKTVKALGDFPNVLYLLSFDREVVAKSVESLILSDGHKYLEKIVQATFELPAIPQPQLNQYFTSELSKLLSNLGIQGRSPLYFHNVFFDGLEQYLQKPRDAIRIISVLQVTLPALIREVNWVDFIALEFLRIFEPTAYQIIRQNRKMFTGTLAMNDDLADTSAFHKDWLNEFPPERRVRLQSLMVRMFPRVDAAVNNRFSDAKSGFRDLNLYCDDFWPVYFSFGVPDAVLSRTEATQMLELIYDFEAFGKAWLELKKVRRIDGHSKARDMLDAIPRMINGLGSDSVSQLLRVILQTQESLLIPEDEAGAFNAPNHWRVTGTLHRLLEIVPFHGRADALRSAMIDAKEISAATSLLRLLRGDLPGGIDMDGVDSRKVKELQEQLSLRILSLSLSDLLVFDGQQLIIYTLADVLGEDRVRAHYQPILDYPQMLLKFLRGSTSRGSMSVDGDRVATSVLCIPSAALDKITDRSHAEKAVESLRSVPDISSEDIMLIDAYFAPDFSERTDE